MIRKASKADGKALEAFIHRWQLTRKQAATALGVSERMLYAYLEGRQAVPLPVSITIKALDENWRMKR